MGPISGVNNRQTDPYLQWREKLEERNAERVKAKEAEEKALDPQKVKGAGEEKENIPVRRTRDEYVPERAGDPDNGKTPKSDKASKQAEGKKPEVCKASTDKVDREIEKLKKRKEELEGRLRTEKDERQIRKLESELAQIERELSRKDNDTYRRQHTEITRCD